MRASLLRISSPTAPWLNAPGGYFSDVTTGGSATQVTAVDITLPADANGAATLEVRFLTTNAPGSDEWVGIDDIVVSSTAIGAGETQTVQFNPVSVTHDEGNSGTTTYTFTVTRTGGTTGQLDFSGTVAHSFRVAKVVAVTHEGVDRAHRVFLVGGEEEEGVVEVSGAGAGDVAAEFVGVR